MIDDTKYGVISDIHGNDDYLESVFDEFECNDVDELIVNGDIVDRYNTLNETQDHLAYIIGNIAEKGLRTFVQPGSHETILAYEPVVEHMKEEYSNVFDTKDLEILDKTDHDVLFLPGSDFLAGGEYKLGDELPTGSYVLKNDKAMKYENWQKYLQLAREDKVDGSISYKNYEDLKDIVRDPEKSVVFCHVPRKFEELENGVDMAEFGESKETFTYNGKTIGRGTVFPKQHASKLKGLGYPVELKEENRGNDGLKEVFEKLNLKKAVSGHFHESVHRAHDSQGIYVPEDEYTSELFWNSSCLKDGRAGILSVNDNEVKYHNIEV